MTLLLVALSLRIYYRYGLNLHGDEHFDSFAVNASMDKVTGRARESERRGSVYIKHDDNSFPLELLLLFFSVFGQGTPSDDVLVGRLPP